MSRDLRRYCERLANIERERAELAADAKEIKQEIKSAGFDVTLANKIVRLMLMEDVKRKEALEQIELFDTYLSATGLLRSSDDEIAEQISPRPAVSPSVQNEGEGNQGLDQVAQKAEDCKPLSAGAAKAGQHSPDPSNVVTDAGEGEGAPTSVDPAPAPDVRKPLPPVAIPKYMRDRFPDKYPEVSP
ncbi:MAG: DUF2312 domain-containing protein [Cryobacterium sp.]|nr:DUF2312 domain-containing protein [Cryobacterium sp.]CAH1678130.1 conserved hypothetical protein [Hyphomicrobiales bacterium]